MYPSRSAMPVSVPSVLSPTLGKLSRLRDEKRLAECGPVLDGRVCIGGPLEWECLANRRTERGTRGATQRFFHEVVVVLWARRDVGQRNRRDAACLQLAGVDTPPSTAGH